MPSMADGRCVTSWLPSCSYDHILQRKFKVPGNAQFRAFLQTNMAAAYAESRKLNVCSLNPRFVDVIRTTGQPMAKLVRRRKVRGPTAPPRTP